LANKDKKTAAKPAEGEATIRIKASDAGASKKSAQIKNEPKIADKQKKTPRKNPLRAIGGYFAGAWSELKQVRWPTRSATWGMTAAMLGFTAFFVVVILLLDALFKYVFQLILG